MELNIINFFCTLLKTSFFIIKGDHTQCFKVRIRVFFLEKIFLKKILQSSSQNKLNFQFMIVEATEGFSLGQFRRQRTMILEHHLGEVLESVLCQTSTFNFTDGTFGKMVITWVRKLNWDDSNWKWSAYLEVWASWNLPNQEDFHFNSEHEIKSKIRYQGIDQQPLRTSLISGAGLLLFLFCEEITERLVLDLSKPASDLSLCTYMFISFRIILCLNFPKPSLYLSGIMRLLPPKTILNC